MATLSQAQSLTLALASSFSLDAVYALQTAVDGLSSAERAQYEEWQSERLVRHDNSATVIAARESERQARLDAEEAAWEAAWRAAGSSRDSQGRQIIVHRLGIKRR